MNLQVFQRVWGELTEKTEESDEDQPLKPPRHLIIPLEKLPDPAPKPVLFTGPIAVADEEPSRKPRCTQAMPEATPLPESVASSIETTLLYDTPPVKMNQTTPNLTAMPEATPFRESVTSFTEMTLLYDSSPIKSHQTPPILTAMPTIARFMLPDPTELDQAEAIQVSASGFGIGAIEERYRNYTVAELMNEGGQSSSTHQGKAAGSHRLPFQSWRAVQETSNRMRSRNLDKANKPNPHNPNHTLELGLFASECTLLVRHSVGSFTPSCSSHRTMTSAAFAVQLAGSVNCSHLILTVTLTVSVTPTLMSAPARCYVWCTARGGRSHAFLQFYVYLQHY